MGENRSGSLEARETSLSSGSSGLHDGVFLNATRRAFYRRSSQKPFRIDRFADETQQNSASLSAARGNFGHAEMLENEKVSLGPRLRSYRNIPSLRVPGRLSSVRFSARAPSDRVRV